MNIDDINTDTITVTEGEFDQIADMLGADSEITARELQIETEDGETLRVRGHADVLISKEDRSTSQEDSS